MFSPYRFKSDVKPFIDFESNCLKVNFLLIVREYHVVYQLRQSLYYDNQIVNARKYITVNIKYC